tara:strand:- start:754 stop:1995 length:1242 start_codon:yes stop_codon:yes gene_type:complete
MIVIIDQSHYITAAQKVGNDLLKKVIWDGPRCNWVEASLNYNQAQTSIQVNNLGNDIYTGLSGILYFTTALYAYTRDEMYKEIVCGIIENLKRRYSNDKASWSFYTSHIGILYALYQASNLISDYETKEWVGLKLKELIHSPIINEEIEVLYGVSSAVEPLKILLEDYFPEDLISTLIKIGNHIIDKSISEGNAVYWKPTICDWGLSGLSHGAAGISNALLSIYQITEDEKYLNYATKGIEFENQLFSPLVQNWLDKRNIHNNPSEESYAMAWCNGAPGIGLSRLRAWQITQNEEWKEQGIKAMNKTSDYIYQSLNSPLEEVNFSLCHGVCGNAEILRQADEIMNTKSFERTIKDVADFGVYHFDAVGLDWPGGVLTPNTMKPLSTLSLMMGSTGIGLFYLKAANPSEVKIIL